MASDASPAAETNAHAGPESGAQVSRSLHLDGRAVLPCWTHRARRTAFTWRCGTHPPPRRPRTLSDPRLRDASIKEVTMTRRIRLWIAAVLTVAAAGLTMSLTITAHAGADHAHPSLALTPTAVEYAVML